MKKKLFLSLLSITLFGCGENSDIKAVKQSRFYDIDDTLTIEQVFKTWNDCSNGQWDSFEDNRGRHVVKYTCSLSDKYLNTVKNTTLKKLREYQSHNQWQFYIDSKTEKLNAEINRRDALLHDIKNSFSTFIELTNSINEISDRLLALSGNHFGYNIQDILNGQENCEKLKLNTYRSQSDQNEADKIYDDCITIVQPKIIKIRSILNSQDAKMTSMDRYIVINKLNDIAKRIKQGEPSDYGYWEKNIKERADISIKNYQVEIDKDQKRTDEVREMAREYEQKVKIKEPKVSFSWTVTDSYYVKPLEGEFSLINYENKKVSVKSVSDNAFKKMVSIAYIDTKNDQVSMLYISQLSRIAGFDEILKEMRKTGVLIESDHQDSLELRAQMLKELMQ